MMADKSNAETFRGMSIATREKIMEAKGILMKRYRRNITIPEAMTELIRVGLETLRQQEGQEELFHESAH